MFAFLFATTAVKSAAKFVLNDHREKCPKEAKKNAAQNLFLKMGKRLKMGKVE